MPSRRGSGFAVPLALLAGLAILVGACGPAASPSPTSCGSAPAAPGSLQGWDPPQQPPHVTPYLIASPGQLVAGSNRVLFTFLDCTDRPIGAPGRTASMAIFQLDVDQATPLATVDGVFVWAIENERGIYVANVSFPAAGRYGAEFTTTAAGGTPEAVRLTFDVQASSAVIKVGDAAPASKTPTLADVDGDLAKISTDTTPVRAFYETSVDQALAGGEPFVLVFATPKFCTSAQCGPTLDRVKPYVARYPSVTFINVEPYKLKLVDGALEADLNAAGELQATSVVADEWHLFNEPTIYVVDREGIVRANFELIFSDAELTAALDGVK